MGGGWSGVVAANFAFIRRALKNTAALTLPLALSLCRAKNGHISAIKFAITIFHTALCLYSKWTEVKKAIKNNARSK